jgi:hypothetical protein
METESDPVPTLDITVALGHVGVLNNVNLNFIDLVKWNVGLFDSYAHCTL